ncbi:hypothetical protein Tco_1485425 [Tanacetum coccineum]
MSDAGINGHSIGIGGRYDDAIHVIRTDISSDHQMGSGTYEANNQPYMYPHDLHMVSPMSTTDLVLDGIILDETLLLLANSVLRRDIVEGLIDLLDTHNALVQLFKTTWDMLGAIVYETGPEANMDYDIVLEEHSGQPQRVNKLRPC